MQKLPVCEICSQNQSKYTCPRCKIHTCSLVCFNDHKTQKNCSGKSDTSQGTRDTYVPQKQISGEEVQRDYNFLLNVNRSLELTKRNKENLKILKLQRRNNHNHHNNRKNNGSNQILLHGVRVRKVPLGMERGRINKSGGGKNNTFFWTVEWLLIDKDCNIEKKYLRFRAVDTAVLSNLIPKDWIADTDSNFSILFKDTEKNCFINIPSNATLSDALSGKLVIEFPTLYILASPLDEFTQKITQLNDTNKETSSDSSSSSESSSDSSSESESDSDTAPEESSSKKPCVK